MVCPGPMTELGAFMSRRGLSRRRSLPPSMACVFTMAATIFPGLGIGALSVTSWISKESLSSRKWSAAMPLSRNALMVGRPSTSNTFVALTTPNLSFAAGSSTNLKVQRRIGIFGTDEAFFTFGKVRRPVLDHPMVPGPTSAIEKGPWHYGADYVTVYFNGDSSKLDELVPRPFQVDGGLCMAYVCEIVSVSDTGARMVSSEPDRTLYHEAAVGIKCRYGNRQGVYFPVMWVTTEWSLLRGLLNGYQKRLADKIALTKLHPLNPGLRPMAPGMEFGGFCVKGHEKTLTLKVTLGKQGALADLPIFGATFGMRRFPQTDPSQGAVDEPVEILKSNSRVSDVWVGEGWAETTLDVGKIEPVSGAVYRGGFTISGSKVLR